MSSTARTFVAGILLTATLAAAGCGEDSEPRVTLPSPATSSPAAPIATTSPPPASTPQQVVDVYEGMQRAFLKAGAAADPDHPDLARYAAGAALQQLTALVRSMRNQGLRARGEAVFHARVESMAPTRARVRDCMDTSRTERYKANGDPFQDSPGGLRLVIADLERFDTAWKVTGLTVHAIGSCKL
jgi:hypothetical protein